MKDSKAPHKAVCLIKLEVHEVNKTGECSGKILSKEELSKFGIQPKLILTVNGFDKFECLKKLKKVLNEFETK